MVCFLVWRTPQVENDVSPLSFPLAGVSWYLLPYLDFFPVLTGDRTLAYLSYRQLILTIHGPYKGLSPVSLSS